MSFLNSPLSPQTKSACRKMLFARKNVCFCQTFQRLPLHILTVTQMTNNGVLYYRNVSETGVLSFLCLLVISTLPLLRIGFTILLVVTIIGFSLEQVQ